jgi:hypothetical protein
MKVLKMFRKAVVGPNLNWVILSMLLTFALCQVSWAQGDNLWNIRENADDRFHENTPWLRPWRYNYDDGVGRWVGYWTYEVPWGSVSTTGNSSGALSVSRSRDHQFHAWTYVYVTNAKNITLTGGGDCVPRVFLNYEFDSPMGFSANLNLNSGWNRIDITGYNQNDSYYFTCGSLADLVDIMNSSEIPLNQPPIADADGPHVTDEGTAVIFDGSGSYDPDGDLLEYRWDFDNDGIWDTEWSGSPIATHTWFDDWSGVAMLEVSDGEYTDTDSSVVIINNVAPSADAGPDQVVDEGDIVTFAGDFVDPGILDFHIINWDFGDGDTADGTLMPTHAYGDNDTYAVTLSVTDDDDGIGEDTALITVNNVTPAVNIDFVDQPNPNFILPHHTLTFNGGFTDPGWLDIHAAQWNFDDGSVVPDDVVEENEPPDATGNVVEQHVYQQPGMYFVTLTITDDDGGAGESLPWVVTVLNPGQGVQAIDNYIQDLEDDDFDKNAKQRKKSLHNRLQSVIDMIDAGEFQDAIDHLQDIRSQADGSLGGNQNNDWITDPTAQQEICAMIDDIIVNLQLVVGP